MSIARFEKRRHEVNTHRIVITTANPRTIRIPFTETRANHRFEDDGKTCKTLIHEHRDFVDQGSVGDSGINQESLNLRPGDKIDLTLEGQRLVLERKVGRIAKLKRGPFGRMVLTTSPRMPVTTADVIALLEELP